jgi:hypothetical protein
MFIYIQILGSKEDRGIIGFNQCLSQEPTDDSTQTDPYEMYELPWIGKYLDRISVTRYIPVCPAYRQRSCSCRRRKKKEEEEEDIGL